MTKLLKLLLICFLAATVFTAKYRFRQPPQETLDPPSGGNETNATDEQTSQEMEGDADDPFAFPGMEQEQVNEPDVFDFFPRLDRNVTNATKQRELPGMQGNATNATEEPDFLGLENNQTEQPEFPGMEGDIKNDTDQSDLLPGEEGEEAEQPDEEEMEIQPEPQSSLPGFPDIEDIINREIAKAQNFSLKSERPKPATPQPSAGQQGIQAQTPIETGTAFASSTIVNVDQPVISVNGQAMGTIQPDLIKIGAVISNQGENAEETLNQNSEAVSDLIEKIKDLGITDKNILNLGQMFKVSKKTSLRNIKSDNQTEGQQQNPAGLLSYTQLEIQAKDIQNAGKIVDLLQSEGHEVKYIDFGYQPETLAFAVNNLISLAMADAENRAKGGLSGTGYQIGKLLNLNVNVNPDFKNFVNQNQGNIPPSPKIVNVIISATYSMQQGTQPAVEPEQPLIPSEQIVSITDETPEASEQNNMDGETETPPVASVRRRPRI